MAGMTVKLPLISYRWFMFVYRVGRLLGFKVMGQVDTVEREESGWVRREVVSKPYMVICRR